MQEEVPEKVERWTAGRRSALILSIIKGETSVAEAARRHGLTVREVEQWKERFMEAAQNALRSRPKDEEALKEAEIRKLKEKVGELVLESDIWKAACKIRGIPNPLEKRSHEE